MNVLVISSEEYLTLRLLKCLAPLGAVVHVVASTPSPSLRASRYCRHFAVFPLSQPTGMIGREIDHYCARHDIDVILPSGIESVFLISALQGRLRTSVLPAPPSDLLRRLNNKWDFSRLLGEIVLPYPESRLVREPEDALGLDLRFPVIAKPLELDAGRGVVRCDSAEAVWEHVASHIDSLPLMIQEFIPGADVGLGLLAVRGEIAAWTIQKHTADGSGIEFIEHAEILEIGRRLMAKLRYSGIAHFDMRLDDRDGSVKVLECNPRFWASLPFCMVAGVNYPALGIRLALGQPLPALTPHPISLTFPSRVFTGGWPVAAPTRSALRFTLADPLPHVCSGARRFGRRIKTLLRLQTTGPAERKAGMAEFVEYQAEVAR